MSKNATRSRRKLRVWLPDNWVQMDNPDGPATFHWDDDAATGAFQVSVGEYRSGSIPNADGNALLNMALSFGRDQKWDSPVSTSVGSSPFGSYGTAVFELSDASDLDARER